MSSKVSIIVPVHNAAHLLESCVNSLLEQTYSNLEIILINNASTDNSLSMCQQLRERDKRVIVIHTDEAGVSNARNLGLECVTGEFVTFVDSDDWLELNCIERAIAEQKQSGADVVIWSFFKNIGSQELRLAMLPEDKKFFTTDLEKKYLYKKSIDAQFDKISSANDVSVGTTWGKLYSTDLIQQNNLRFVLALTRAQDVVFSIQAFKQAQKIYYFNESLYHYRIHSSSTCQSSRFIADTTTPFNTLAEELLLFAQGFSNNKDVLSIIDYRIIRIIYWHFDHNYFHPKNPKPLLSKRKEFLQLLKKSYYRDALYTVELNKLPKQRRVMVFLLRKRMVFMFYVFEKLLLIRNRFLQLNN